MFGRIALVFLLVVVSQNALSQNVTTWHNDNNRTGWQQNETTLNQSSVQTGFGLLWQWILQDQYSSGYYDQAYAQPLAANITINNTNYNVVFVATEQDMLYAFQADSSSQTALWTLDLAKDLANYGLGSWGAVDCRQLQPPCRSGLIYPFIGVTGTPVIDTNNNALYVVSAVQSPPPGTQQPQPTVAYFLHAINITTGSDLVKPVQIQASFSGLAPTTLCATASGTAGNISFDPYHHIQRTGLLLVNISGTDVIYFGFSPVRDSEEANGWVLGYSYTSSGLQQVAAFVPTPYGTGGGVWEAGAALASDGSYIYLATANGTFNTAGSSPANYGESMIKLSIGNGSNNLGNLSVSDYFTPTDYPYRCANDKDFGSGGVLLIPDSIITSHPNAMINADKDSYLWTLDRGTLGGVNGSGLVQQLQQPTPIGKNVPGYWSSAAYWKYLDSNRTPNYQVYYAPDETTLTVPAYPMSMYTITSSGLPSGGPYPSTQTLFCANPHAPTPSISSSGTTQNSGALWAIESSNTQNAPPNPTCPLADIGFAVLHAYNPVPQSQTLTQLYSSSGLSTTVGDTVAFPTPTIFNSRVYMGTKREIDVFGICSPTCEH